MSYEYWNDLAIEKTKSYYIENASDPKLINFIQNETNLQRCFQDALEFTKQFGGVHGNVLEIGAGVAWTSALISQFDKVDSITAVDYSNHRLKKIAPIVFEQLKGNKDKFRPIEGDFLELDFRKKQYNTIIFCQSLYMFPDMEKVLKKVSALLAHHGVIIVACERITSKVPTYSINNLKRKLRYFSKGRRDLSGNYYYVDSEYRSSIENAGLSYYFQLLDYPVYPKNSTLKAGNHFGIKDKG